MVSNYSEQTLLPFDFLENYVNYTMFKLRLLRENTLALTG